MLNQISLFTENNEGGLFKITTILAKANINIYTMLANDSAEFGIVRLDCGQGRNCYRSTEGRRLPMPSTRLLL